MSRTALLVPLVTLALVLPMLINHAGAAAEKEADPEPALTHSPINRVWKIEGRRHDELVFVRDVGHEPVVDLNSLAFRGREVNVDIETDSNTLALENRAGKIELRLQPAKRYRLVLDGDADKPRIKLGSKELSLQAPEWDRIINDERTSSFRIVLRGATEARIKLSIRGGDIPLRKPEGDDEKK